MALLALAAAATWIVNLTSDPDGGANIGAGLLGMLVVLVGSFVWGLRDARGSGMTRDLLVLWLLAGVIVGAGFAVLPQFGSEEFFSVDLYLSDLPVTGLLGLGLVLVPSWIGIGIGRASRPSAASAESTS